MTRPEDLLYAVDEMPTWPRLVVLGMQHAMLQSVNLVLIVIVFRRAGAGDAATLSALSLGMTALAIATVLQSGKVRSARETWRRRYSRRSISAPPCWRPAPVGFRPCSG